MPCSALLAGPGARAPWEEAPALGAAHACMPGSAGCHLLGGQVAPAHSCVGVPTHWGSVRGSSCSTVTHRSARSAGLAPSEPPCPLRPARQGYPAAPPLLGRPGGGGGQQGAGQETSPTPGQATSSPPEEEDEGRQGPEAGTLLEAQKGLGSGFELGSACVTSGPQCTRLHSGDQIATTKD